MNILHISTYLQGGAGKVIQDLAIEQKHRGHSVVVAINGQEYPGYVNYPEYLKTLNACGVNTIKIDGLFKRDVFLNIDAARNIHKTLLCYNIDFIHSHAAVPSLAAILGRSNIGRYIPVIQTMHGWGINKNHVQDKMDISILNLIDRIISVTKSDKELLESKGADNSITVIYNGVEDDVVARSEKNEGGGNRNGNDSDDRACSAEEAKIKKELFELKKNKVLIGCIGTICKRKNQELILKALPKLENIAQFVFIGEDDENIIEGSGAEGIVHYGYLSNANRYISCFDYLILPSRNEGFSIVILESLMNSTPVIVSDLPTFKECIDDNKHGFIFEDNNENSLVTAIQKAVVVKHGREPTYRKMQNSCRNEYENRFTFSKMMKHYDDIYQSLTKFRSSSTNS